jgi:hypothetical protein
MPIIPETFLSQVNFVNVSSISDITVDEAMDIMNFETMLLSTDGYTRALVQEGLVHVKRDSGCDKLEVVVSNGAADQIQIGTGKPYERYTTPSRANRMPILRGQKSDNQKSVRLTLAMESLKENGTIFSM